MKKMKKKIPILGPLLGLIDSRKAQVAIGSVIAVVLVQRAGMTETEANAISGAIVLLAGVLIHAIMKEDVAEKMWAGENEAGEEEEEEEEKEEEGGGAQDG